LPLPPPFYGLSVGMKQFKVYTVKYGVRSPKFIWAPVFHWLRPSTPPSPRIYEGAIGQPG
jgi:hypothetical protein